VRIIGLLIKGVVIAFAGLLMIGAGLCSMAALPGVLVNFNFGLLLLNALGWLIAIGAFFLIRSLVRTGSVPELIENVPTAHIPLSEVPSVNSPMTSEPPESGSRDK
jgi:hypothetical protein